MAPENGNWKGGRVAGKKGYVRVWMPEHPRADSIGYVYEHILVLERSLGALSFREKYPTTRMGSGTITGQRIFLYSIAVQTTQGITSPTGLGGTMSEGIVKYDRADEMTPMADDTLIAVARTAEARIDAVIKIKQLALKVTNPRDWTDQQGNPYLQVSGAEKIANLFNVSWSFLTPEPICETEADGHYTYTFQGRFTMGGRSIEVEGSRSSKDSFFKQKLYEDGKDAR